MLDRLTSNPAVQIKRTGDARLLYVEKAIGQMSDLEDPVEKQRLEQAAWDQIPEWLGPMLDPEAVTIPLLLQHNQHDVVVLLRDDQLRQPLYDAMLGVFAYGQQVLTGGFVADCPVLLLTADLSNGIAIGCAHVGSPELLAGLHTKFLSEWRKLVGHRETCGYISRHIAAKDYEWLAKLPPHLEPWRREIGRRMCFDLLGVIRNALGEVEIGEDNVFIDSDNTYELAGGGRASSHRRERAQAGRDFAGFIIQT